MIKHPLPVSINQGKETKNSSRGYSGNICLYSELTDCPTEWGLLIILLWCSVALAWLADQFSMKAVTRVFPWG